MALDGEEAAKLATAIQNVARHYPVSVQQKHLDWAALLFAVGTMYGTRAVAIRIRTAAEAEEKKQRGPQSSVVTFPGQMA